GEGNRRHVRRGELHDGVLVGLLLGRVGGLDLGAVPAHDQPGAAGQAEYDGQKDERRGARSPRSPKIGGRAFPRAVTGTPRHAEPRPARSALILNQGTVAPRGPSGPLQSSPLGCRKGGLWMQALKKKSGPGAIGRPCCSLDAFSGGASHLSDTRKRARIVYRNEGFSNGNVYLMGNRT